MMEPELTLFAPANGAGLDFIFAGLCPLVLAAQNLETMDIQRRARLRLAISPPVRPGRTGYRGHVR